MKTAELLRPELVHSLGIILALAISLACAALAVRQDVRAANARRRAVALLGGPRPAARRQTDLRTPVILPAAPAAGGPPERRVGPDRAAVREWAMAIGAGCVGSVLVGGFAGIVLGAAGGYATWRWRQHTRDRAAAQAEERGVREQLAITADLLAACLAAGAGPAESAAAVGTSLGGPVGERLRRTAAELRLGSEAADSWGRLAELPGARELSRCLARAGVSGAPAVGSVSRIAADLRREWGRAASEAARRAGVLVTLPLAVCFLPAFLTLGVAPVLIGLADGLLHPE